MQHDVIIVGAGIIGASLAWHLARAGRTPLVIDAQTPGAGASGRSFGWINASFYADTHHHRLRAASMEEWGAMSDRLPEDALRFRGALLWDVDKAEQDRMTTELRAQGYPVEQIDRARFAAMAPAVSDAPMHSLFLREGAAEADQVAAAWLAQSGAQVLTGLAVTGFTQENGAIRGVQTETGPISARQVVVAAGVATQGLLATAGLQLPMLRRPGLLMRTRPVAPCLDSILVTPFGEVRQDATGRILASTVAGHQGDTTEYVQGSPQTHGLATLDKLNALLPGLDLQMESVAHALRPVPADGLPVVGAIGPVGMFVATMHSGVTLAPIAGKLLALEMQGQPQDAWLAPYRPDRF